jgi:hypothetical protein
LRLDNSAFTLYMICPQKYFERYEYEMPPLQLDIPANVEGGGMAKACDVSGTSGGNPASENAPSPSTPGIEIIARSREGLDFGTRFHQLYENRSRELLGLGVKIYPEWPDNAIEDECQACWAAYEAHYPSEPFEVLSCERTEAIRIPGTDHELVVKLDRAVRFADRTIGPMDLKTESTPGYNTRESWAGRTQASLYLWALAQLYPRENVSRLVVDIVTRGNSKRAPTFTRLDDISRPPSALEEAVHNVAYVCDRIESHRRSGFWPANMNICKDGWRRCEYFDLHVYGKTDANLRLYRPAEAYLDGIQSG